MKPARFDYIAATDANDALAELAGADLAAKPIAGAQSLGPMLNLRLARPSKVVDVSMLPELRDVRHAGEFVEIGAAITHAELEDGEVEDPTNGWLRDAAGGIAHRAIRNRGTIGGSLAHADPAADWVIVMTGLAATIVIQSADSERRVAMDEFITGPFETALRNGELIRSVAVPKPGKAARWGYWKFVRQVGEFAKASATVLIDPERSVTRVSVGALGRQPLVLDETAAAQFVGGHVSAGEVLLSALPDRTREDLALHTAALKEALAIAKSAAGVAGGVSE